MRKALRPFGAAGLALILLALPPFAATAGAEGAGASRFMDGFDDLPLMPALTQEPGSVTVFDSPYGRIVEAYASGRATPRAVEDFYAAALPQLGWRPSGRAGAWAREGEVLTLDIDSRGAAVTVRFQVSPPD
jgi:hypothetical protein